MAVATPGASSLKVVEFMGEESFAGVVTDAKNAKGTQRAQRGAGALGREGRERFSGEGGGSKEAIVGWERASLGLGEPDLGGFGGGIGVLVGGCGWLA